MTSAVAGSVHEIRELATPPRDPSLELRLPELSYGSIWLVGAGNGDPRNLSPLALHAISVADAVIHDPGVSKRLLHLVKSPHYAEAAQPHLAAERSIKLAQDGWRVVHLVAGNTVERAFASALPCAARNIPLRVVPSIGERIDGEAPLGLFFMHKSVSLGRSDHGSVLLVLVAAAQTLAAPEQRQPPLGFSMSGLAG